MGKGRYVVSTSASFPPMRVAIIEDEPLAAERLRGLLGDYPGPGGPVEVVAEAESVAEVIDAYPTWHAELLLCDIRLADGLSFNIWDRLRVDVPTIFTTAYEEYALRAFKVNSVDYLLKPIKPAELYAALRRFAERRTRPDETAPAPVAVTPELVAEVARMVRGERYRERLLSKVGDRLTPLPVDGVAYFLSLDRITWAYGFDGRRHPVSETLDELDGALDPARFRRLNRACIAQARAVEQLTAYSNSRFRAHLAGHSGEPVVVARDRVPGVKAWLAGDTA